VPTSTVVDNIIPPYTVKSYHTAAEIVWPGSVFYLLFLVFTFSVALVIDLKDVNELLHLCML
jgi:hypothetical protein